ncbi:isoprenyl transferase [Nitratireductor sp. GCM10026969]|uniref:isoprenyl transferase n=1 Tax=Nitratireductor sp. GCM10026969 TaxID=3252645 RepID=UPI00360F07AF
MVAARGCRPEGEKAVKPAHIAIIMDGNGRWARARGLPRTAGHRAGVEALRRTVRAAGEMGIRWLTVYAFSSENWSRPKAEVSDLMGLLKLFIRRDLAELHQNGVRVRIVGKRDGLEPDIAALLGEAESLTAGNTNMNLVVAFNYGGRDEILRAARALAVEAKAGRLDPEDVTMQDFEARLDTADMPDPDLIIRTSGEQRLSNFLLWQAAYAEFVFVPCRWPDFGSDDLAAAIAVFEERDRRFGGAAAQEAVS